MPYAIYERLIDVAAEGDENKLFAWGRNWMDLNGENPFLKNTKEHDLYFQAKRFYDRWRRGGIDSRSGRLRMVKAIRELMALHVPNPYQAHVLGIVPDEEVDQMVNATEEQIVETTDVAKDDTHMFGVVPEFPGDGFIASYEPVEVYATPEDVPEGIPELVIEPAPEKKHKKRNYFSRHKE